ncbi:FMN reductase [Frankineae bacterium MT45]|nr:FMN reductase [Frankineae bacterium MT45]
MKVAVVAGNPKPNSRTLAAATLVAERLTGRAPETVVDVVTLGPGLLGWGDPAVTAAVESVRQSDYLICASPTYKATYTGLLKLFLDQFPSNGLEGVTAFALMLGAGPQHALAPELLLKPVLAELGASLPSRALYLLDSEWETSAALGPWVESAQRYLTLESAS